MTVAGIIAEYNPLHNGHAWHLATTRRALDAEAVVIVMSGHFTQRGEPVIADKWSRAAMALACGADLVMELPTLYACSRATWFAHGAISLLDQMGVITHLSFGSEVGELEPLSRIAQVLEQDPPELKNLTQELSKQGLAHPRAQAEALHRIQIEELSPELMTTANNILAIEYLRTLLRHRSKIAPWTVKRQGSAYHDPNLGPMASATAIRRAILDQEPSLTTADSLPSICTDILNQQFKSGRGPVSWNSLQLPMLASLRRADREELAQLPEVSEGLENRIRDASDAQTIEQWLQTIKTKRYTQARLTRTLAHLFLGITKADLEQMNLPVPYARVLAMNTVGRELLRRCREQSGIPIIHKPMSARGRITPWGERLLDLDRLATDLWTLGFPEPQKRKGAQDLTHEPVRMFESPDTRHQTPDY